METVWQRVPGRRVCNSKRPRAEIGLWTRMGQTKHVLHGAAHWRYLANTIGLSVCGGSAAFLSNYFDHFFDFIGRIIGRIAVYAAIAIDGVARSVCRSVTIVRPAKTAELIDMPFVFWARDSGGIREPNSRWVQIVPMPRGNLEGKGHAR